MSQHFEVDSPCSRPDIAWMHRLVISEKRKVESTMSDKKS